LKKILFKCFMLATVFMIVAGCSNSGTTSVKGNTNENTIRMFLNLELIGGPNKEFEKAFEQVDTTGNSTLLDAYNKKYYQSLLAKSYYQDFINTKYELFWLQPALKEGYQLKPTSIEIKNEKGYYDCNVKVDYTKDGKTQTSTINGHIQLNEKGKITSVRFIEGDNGLWKLWKGFNQP
jgi:hypothetical protein